MSKSLKEMDKSADKAIMGWSFAALGANLLPPPFDMIAVGGVFAKLGRRLAEIYEVEIDWSMLFQLGKSIAKGVSTTLSASYIGTGLLKYVPGVNLWVALLVQPPIVAAVAYSAGQAFKSYFHVCISGGKDLTRDQMRDLAAGALRARLAT
jgi:hypothetical protein